jgi:DNA-binding IclR family transcriptional regulator
MFAAHLAPARWQPLLNADPVSAAVEAAFRREVEQARRCGLAHAVDSAPPAISALAAPIFVAGGQMARSLTVIGPGAMLRKRSRQAGRRASCGAWPTS